MSSDPPVRAQHAAVGSWGSELRRRQIQTDRARRLAGCGDERGREGRWRGERRREKDDDVVTTVRKLRVGRSYTMPGEAGEEIDNVAQEARVAGAERGGRG